MERDYGRRTPDGCNNYTTGYTRLRADGRHIMHGGRNTWSYGQVTWWARQKCLVKAAGQDVRNQVRGARRAAHAEPARHTRDASGQGGARTRERDRNT